MKQSASQTVGPFFRIGLIGSGTQNNLVDEQTAGEHITLTGAVYDAFLGAAERAFYYGHSYTANALGCAAALASLEVFEQEQTLANLTAKIDRLHEGLAAIKSRQPLVHEIRQCGFVAGIELRLPDGTKFPPAERFGEAVCAAARRHGLLTRPILDTIVLMLPLSSSHDEIDLAIKALEQAIGGQ